VGTYPAIRITDVYGHSFLFHSQDYFYMPTYTANTYPKWARLGLLLDQKEVHGDQGFFLVGLQFIRKFKLKLTYDG